MADFPVVPIAPGVPTLNRGVGVASFLPDLLTQDVVGSLLGLLGLEWGIYYFGVPVFQPDNIVEFGYKNSSAISDYPLEQGAFESYNKVANPFDIRVSMTVGGSPDRRALALFTIDELAKTLFLYDVVTPEKTYLSCNIVHYDYQRRAANGVGLIKFDIWLRQVRVTASAGFTSTATPSGASTVNGGTPQTQAPTAAQSAAAGGIQ